VQQRKGVRKCNFLAYAINMYGWALVSHCARTEFYLQKRVKNSNQRSKMTHYRLKKLATLSRNCGMARK